MPLLQGMTWNHPRGLEPLRAASRECARRHPEVAVEWSARSLREFEDVPVDELARRYDVIAIDHPFVGQAATSRAVVALDEVLPAEVITDQRDHAVGPSARSYTMNGHQWALAMDAAAQVSAYRPDLLPELPPRRWDEVVALLKGLPDGVRTELPANPTHLWATFLSLCHHIAVAADPASGRPLSTGSPAWWPAEGILPDVAGGALELLRTLTGLVDPVSWDRDPIGTLDAMADGAPVAYVPLVFGYSNYARPGFARHRVGFADAPSITGEVAGTMTGGVGLAVSARCTDIPAAAEFARYVVSAACQRGTYVRVGGQPAHRSAWTDPAVDELVPGFFPSTLATVEASFVRPRSPGYPAYQQKAGRLLHERLRRGEPTSALVRDLGALWRASGGYGEAIEP
jgi:multiple sugar transport system substrate-binding protein